MGAPHPCDIDEKILIRGWVNFTVHGKREITFLGVLKTFEKGRKDLEGIRGLSLQNNGEVVNPTSTLSPRLSSMPFTAHHMITMDPYKK
jgi:hypothetical protein